MSVSLGGGTGREIARGVGRVKSCEDLRTAIRDCGLQVVDKMRRIRVDT